MVTIGFIVEGDSEAILLKDNSFIDFLATLQLFSSKDLIINAGGKYKLYHPTADFSTLELRVNGWIETLIDKGASTIFILLDFDNSDVDFTTFKQKVYHKNGNIIIIAKQELEAWYLADTNAIINYLGTIIPEVQNPEDFAKPLDEIKRLRLLHVAKGITDKKILTKSFINAGFSLINAANHPQCFSAKYFIRKLLEISEDNSQRLL